MTISSKDAIGSFLREFHVGRSKAVTSRELQCIFHLDGRSIRRSISMLRQAGVPICSDETGYYYADNTQELLNTVSRLGGMIASVIRAKTGLANAIIREKP